MTAIARRLDRRGAFDLLGPPLGAFALAQLAVMLAALVQDRSPWDDASYARNDSFLYLDIATDGYELVACAQIGYSSDGWCGNAGWFPGYPWVVGGFYKLGFPLTATAALIAWACAAAMLVVLWNGVLDRRREPAVYAALAFAAFAPGMIYQHSVFPMSAAALAMVGVLALLRRERYATAAVVGAIGATMYPTMVLLAPLGGGYVLLTRAGVATSADRVRRAALVAAGPVLGAAFVAVVMWLQTDSWDAYFLVQEKYNMATRFPIARHIDQIRPLFDGGRGLAVMPAVQALFVLTLIAVVLGDAARRRVRGFELLVAAVVFVYWAFPYTIGVSSVYRSDSLLVAAAILVGRLPAWLAVPVAGAAAIVAFPMAQAFFQHVLN